MMKNNWIVILVLVLSMAFLGACGVKEEPKNDGEINAYMGNPWTECTDIKDAENRAGFSFEIPEAIEGYSLAWVQNMNTTIIEVVYESTDGRIYFRKGPGSDDISGDYNTYAESKQVTVGSYDVTMKGNDGTVSLAMWTDGGFSYVVSVPNMSEEFVADLIRQIK